MEKIKYTQINDFFKNRDIAIIGVSRNPQEYSRNLFRELLKQNYNVTPVNPNITEIEGHVCYFSVEDIPLPPTAAIILTPAITLANIVQDCINKGIRHIWIYNGNEKDENLKSSIDICRENNVNLVYGFCPFMFLPGQAFPHRIHGRIARIFGKYPVKS